MEIITNQKVTIAKKSHICDFCGYKIIPKEKYHSSVLVDDSIYTFRTHLNCSELAVKLKMYDEINYSEGLTSNDFQEIVHDKYYKLFKTKIPECDNLSEILEQISNVNFKQKLGYLIRYYKVNKL